MKILIIPLLLFAFIGCQFEGAQSMEWHYGDWGMDGDIKLHINETYYSFFDGPKIEYKKVDEDSVYKEHLSILLISDINKLRLTRRKSNPDEIHITYPEGLNLAFQMNRIK